MSPIPPGEAKFIGEAIAGEDTRLSGSITDCDFFSCTFAMAEARSRSKGEASFACCGGVVVVEPPFAGEGGGGGGGGGDKNPVGRPTPGGGGGGDGGGGPP